MKDAEVIDILSGMESKEFTSLGRAKKYGHPEARLRLGELGFSILSDDDMERFRKLHNKAKAVKAAKIMRERSERVERSKNALAARIKEIEGKITVNTQNAVVEGTILVWTCVCGEEKQEIDLAKMSHERGYLKINGKDVRQRRKAGIDAPIRRIAMAKDPGNIGLVDYAEFKGKSKVVGSDKRVPMGSGPDSPAVTRLSQGFGIVFEFKCTKCGFQQQNVEIGVGK